MRLPRLDFPGARHHVMNRGARRAPIFPDADSRQLFLEVLAELPSRFGVRVHGYALMPNHYHLMIESQTGKLSRAMRHLGGEFTRRMNRRHQWDGPIFGGRFHSRLVESDAYWQYLLMYLHLNPARADLKGADAKWTSHQAYTGDEACPPWLTTSELLGHYGENYLAVYQSLRTGKTDPPPDFDPDRLWAPNATGVAPAFEKQPVVPIHQALEEVAQVTGAAVEDLLQVPRGPKPNKANWLAAWWCSQRGIDSGQIVRAMLTSHSSVSLKIRRVNLRQDEDEDLQRWTAALRELRFKRKS